MVVPQVPGDTADLKGQLIYHSLLGGEFVCAAGLQPVDTMGQVIMNYVITCPELIHVDLNLGQQGIHLHISQRTGLGRLKRYRNVNRRGGSSSTRRIDWRVPDVIRCLYKWCWGQGAVIHGFNPSIHQSIIGRYLGSCICSSARMTGAGE